MRVPVIVLLLTAATSGLAAQGTTYRRNPGDTLRYDWSTRGTMDVQGGPGGGMEMNMRIDMRMAVAFFPNDTMRMWMESATMVMNSPMGEMSPPTSAMLNKPFVLRMQPNGRLEVLAIPNLGADMSQMGGATPQVNSLFMTLPKEPLRVGLQWTDTVDTKTSAPDGNQATGRTIAAYQVMRDTMIEGERAFAIDVRSTSQMEVLSSMPAMNMRGQVNSSATEVGTIHFSMQRRALLNRTGTITIESSTQMSGGATAMSMTMRGRTESTMTLVR
jgi:hypothetical protein